MFPEKPKNKRKNSESRRNQLVIVLASAIIIMGVAAIFVILPILFPTDITISNVKTVSIQHDWTGLSPIAPLKAGYQLTAQEDGSLTGTAIFAVSYEGDMQTVDIEIPADIAQAFYDKLESSKLDIGTYTPFFQWTDDYPSFDIVIETEDATVAVYSTSQGEFHVPWGATIDGEDFTINSAVPAEALTMLEPYLKLDVQQDMVNDFRK